MGRRRLPDHIKQMNAEIAAMWRRLRLECLRIHGKEEEWTAELDEGRRLHGKSGWKEREAALELKYAPYLNEAKAKMEAARIEIETSYAIQSGRVQVARAVSNAEAQRKCREADRKAKRLMAEFNPNTGGTTFRDPDKPKPKEIPEPPGGVIEPEGIPSHWKTGSTAEFTKQEIAWAIQCMYLPVGPHDAPTAAAWNLLMMGRIDPKDFMVRWGPSALPKKDTEDTERRFEDDCSDILTELHAEMSRMAAETAA